MRVLSSHAYIRQSPMLGLGVCVCAGWDMFDAQNSLLDLMVAVLTVSQFHPLKWSCCKSDPRRRRRRRIVRQRVYVFALACLSTVATFVFLSVHVCVRACVCMRAYVCVCASASVAEVKNGWDCLRTYLIKPKSRVCFKVELCQLA